MENNSNDISSFLAGYHSRNEEVSKLQYEIDRLTTELNDLKTKQKSLNNYEYDESSKSEETNR